MGQGGGRAVYGGGDAAVLWGVGSVGESGVETVAADYAGGY